MSRRPRIFRSPSGGLSRATRCGIAAAFVGLWPMSTLSQGSVAEPDIRTFDSADAHFEPQGLPAVDRASVNLLRRWDLDFPGRDGRAIYRVVLPRRVGVEAMAVLFSRVGNQAEIRLNGTVLERWGRLGDPAYDAGKVARVTVLPASLLHADSDNDLTVEVTVQQQRWGGLSALQYGPQDAIESLYQYQLRWRHLAVLVFGWSLAAMGALASALWWRQRDPLYGCFSLAALLGVVRDLDRLWPDLPVPWPAWGAFEAACYAVHIVLIARFVQMVCGPLRLQMRWAINAIATSAVLLAVIGFTMRLPWLWTIALATLIPLGLCSLGVVARNAVRMRDRAAWALLAVGAVAVSAGIYDFALIRLGHSSGFRVQLTPPAMFAFVVMMAGIVVQRFNRSVADHRQLNTQLTERLADRERQLRTVFDSLRENERLKSVADERQRIMQEIHDGVGSQLVGLLQLVRAPGVDRQALTHHVTQAIDEMRMAVGSLQPAQDDLVTVLAMLRHRLEPRLTAAGIGLVWQVSDLPSLQPMTPEAALQVQRIVTEVFTNVLKHARATQVVVETFRRPEPPAAVLRITDNGTGLPVAARAVGASGGVGVSGMRRRAEAIGASIRIEAGATGGVSVALEWAAFETD